MDGDNRDRQRQGREEERHHGILQRIEEKLDRLLGRRGGDDWREREWAPLDSPFASYEPVDPAPRYFGGPRADAPGWDPGLAGPRFDRLDVGAVGTHLLLAPTAVGAAVHVDPLAVSRPAVHDLVSRSCAQTTCRTDTGIEDEGPSMIPGEGREGDAAEDGAQPAS